MNLSLPSVKKKKRKSQKYFVSLQPNMCSNWFKYIMTGFLLVMYINRGLFVAGIETSNAHSSSSNEINSLLEIMLNWADGHNDIDEDGDCPETYNAAPTIQPLFDPNSTFATNLTHPNIAARNIFYLLNETISSLSNYGTIDHPPEKLITDNC